MAYFEDILNTTPYLTFDVEYFDPLDTKCKTPKVLAFCVEDSTQILVGLDGLSEGIQVILNTGETGTIAGGVALIELNDPLVYGDEVSVEIDTEECKATSCSCFAGRISANCVSSIGDRPSGELTGRLGCVEKDLYREVYDGDGGVNIQGVLVQENCIYCNGQLPNCIEPPVEVTTFYNIVRCSNGQIYQTDTVFSVSNQRVNHDIHGLHYWNGTTQVSAPNYVGEVTISVGLTLCPEVPVITYYDIVSCADGLIYQTQTVITVSNQRVSHGTFGEHYWNGNTRTSGSINDRGAVTIMTGIFGCS